LTFGPLRRFLVRMRTSTVPNIALKSVAPLVLALSLTVAASPARAQEPPPPAMGPSQAMNEERPSRGVGYLVTGGIFTGLGAANLAASPICLSLPNESVHTPCLVASFVVGGVFLVIGVPLLVVGAGKRSAFKEWQASHPGLAGLGFSADRKAGSLTWSTAF